jgi:hypothetical protein
MDLHVGRLFLFAALVMFVFMLIATIATSGTFLSVIWAVWLAAGLVAWVVDQLFGGEINFAARARTPRATRTTTTPAPPA